MMKGVIFNKSYTPRRVRFRGRAKFLRRVILTVRLQFRRDNYFAKGEIISQGESYSSVEKERRDERLK